MDLNKKSYHKTLELKKKMVRGRMWNLIMLCYDQFMIIAVLSSLQSQNNTKRSWKGRSLKVHLTFSNVRGILS